MNDILKKSPKQIIEEIYSITSFNRKDFNKALFVTKIANDYFKFQQELLKLVNNNILISHEKKGSYDNHQQFKFNNILRTINTSENDSIGMMLKYSTINFDSDNGLYWSTGHLDNMTSLLPFKTSLIHINYNENIKLSTTVIDNIEKYILNHVKELDLEYYSEIERINNFLIPLSETLIFFDKLNLDINLISTTAESYFSLNSIVEKIQKHSEFNDILYLSYDFDIQQHIKKMKQFITSKKTKLDLK